MLTVVDWRNYLGLSTGVTDEEFRGWVREWFKEQVEVHGEDSDRKFARLVSLTATEVNDIRNDKRYPSWGIIGKVTEKLGWRADDFLLDIIKRARRDADARATGAPARIPPGVSRVPRAASQAEAERLRQQIAAQSEEDASTTKTKRSVSRRRGS